MTVSTLDELTKYRWSSDSDDDRFIVENPATGEVITVVQGGGAEQMHAAIAAAHRAFMTDWRWRNRTERGQLLLACADVLEDHATELAELLSLEHGKPVTDARDLTRFSTARLRNPNATVDLDHEMPGCSAGFSPATP